ncbi:MAG: TOBE domain-containing protein, partial [Chromatiales bacterium]
AHREDAGYTLLDWAAGSVEARLNPVYTPGTRVCWAIPPENVILHRRDRPSRGERENPLAGRVTEFIALGENAMVVMQVEAEADLRLHLTVPTHVARRNSVDVGEPIKVSLLAEGIHLMPWEALSPGPAGDT